MTNTHYTQVLLSGPGAADAAEALVLRLGELGIKAALTPGDQAGVELEAAPGPLENNLQFEIDRHDTPDFAAEKIIDLLGQAGAVSLEGTDYSPEQEQRIRDRLADLGYIE